MTTELEQCYEEITPDADDGGIAKDLDLSQFDFMPWKGRFLVEEFPAETMTKGGLHIPDTQQERKNWARVVKFAEGGGPPGVDIGDIVMFHENAGDPVPSLGERMRLLDYRDDFENDVLGVFKRKVNGPATTPPKRRYKE